MGRGMGSGFQMAFSRRNLQKCKLYGTWQGLSPKVRDFDCTYVHPNGLREHTIGYYSQPTSFKCPRYIKLGCD